VSTIGGVSPPAISEPHNAGTPPFVRPLYAGPSWRPAALDYGLLNGDELWSERFVNDV